jgi:cytochrome P450
MRKLTDGVEEITARCVAEMRKQGSPVDLVKTFARPIPGLVIGELLGVSEADRGKFYAAVDRLHRMRQEDASEEDLTAAFLDGREFVGRIVLSKRADPSDDLFSDLATGTDFTDEEIINVAIMLLGAGLDSVAATISLGALALLNNPAQLAELRDNPEVTERAVEEILRYTTIFPIYMRAALEDIELDGHLIEEGDAITIAATAANRDPAKFPDPDTFDLTRTGRGHVAFGHGVHQCLAQQLARVELQVAFPALLRAFPTLHLAAPADQVPVRNEVAFYGLHELPVAW